MRAHGDVRGKYYSAFWNQCSEQMSIGMAVKLRRYALGGYVIWVGGPGRAV